MTNKLDSIRDLPPDLVALDAELASIRYEERPSFGPELEADLAREWQVIPARRPVPVRQLLAAGVAGLLMVGLSVPSARAALVRFVGTLAGTPQAVVTPPPPASVSVPALAGDGRTEVTNPVATSDDVLPGGPPPIPVPVEGYSGPEATFPELLDRDVAEALIRRNYPISFQRAGIGGTVRVLLWVDSTGAVDFVNLGESSGLPDLDRAALQVAPSFHFEPARRRGRPVGTWVEFDVRFEPAESTSESDWLPEVGPVSEPGEVDLRQPALGPEWRQGSALPVFGRLSAGDFLRSALGNDERVIAGLGTMEDILQGEPPAGRSPTAWRTQVGQLLEDAMVRAPDNPAPFLAMARIRRKQGLRTEAQVLLERGLQRAQRNPGAIAPVILADLHFERGTLVKANWMSARNVGRIRADVLVSSTCPQARSSGGAVSGYASVDRLIAWNYLCPEELGQILERSFESLEGGASVDRAVTQASFRSAVEAYPAHVGANVEILLGLADEGRWGDLLVGAQRFVSASGGDPRGLLLTGLALQRLSRSEEAERVFREAAELLPAEESEQIQDISALLLGAQGAEYRRLSQAEQRAWRVAYWRALDPIVATPVNEREVEHMARTAYVLLRFGSTRSDPGEVWVRYGRPDVVRAFEDGADVRTEFWDFGPGPDLTFRRLAASGAMALTPEGRSYLDEVRELVPHRYGSASRQVFALAAQVGRFRAEGGEGDEVAMYARAPGVLTTGGPDSLDVSMVLLGAAGAALSAHTERVPAARGDLSLRMPAPAGVNAVVVEVYSPRTGQAAALRRSAPSLPSASGASMSDVILTVPASPRPGEVRRDGAWMSPLALDQPVRLPAIGAYVELYGVGGVASWYRLRAEVEDRATGEIRDLPIQPAGEGDYRPTWDRRPTAGGATREFLSVLMGAVPPGRYVFRVVADIPDAGAPLTAEQLVDRR